MLGLLWGNRNNYSWLVGVPTAMVTMEIIISIIIFTFILEIFILPWLSGSISTTSISYFALICILAFTDACNLSLSIYHLIRVQLSHGYLFFFICQSNWTNLFYVALLASRHGFVIDHFLYWCWLLSDRFCQDGLYQAKEIYSVLDSS